MQLKWQTHAHAFCANKDVNFLTDYLFFFKAHTRKSKNEKPVLYIDGAQAIYSKKAPAQIQYAALGNLHRYQNIADKPCPKVYNSSLEIISLNAKI